MCLELGRKAGEPVLAGVHCDHSVCVCVCVVRV